MSFLPADPSFAARLGEVLPADTFTEIAPRYLEEPRGHWTGLAGLLAKPRRVEEVATLIRHAGEAGVPVVPYGGGTGLVGGQVLTEGAAPLLISLERMRAVRAVYPDENVILVEAGATLAEVQAAAEKAGRLFPLSLASEGTAQIGGNLATNAGGTGVLRYGNARDLCLGLEAVLPDGQIWHGLTRLRKDNTGYDLRNLLIGAEGTLGIITAAALRLFPRPARQGTALLAVESPAAALTLLQVARERIGEAISAFELMHAQGFHFLAEHLPEIRLPFDPAPEWTVLLEIGGPDTLDPDAALTGLFEAALEQGLVSDGLIAQSAQQSAEFWSVREHLPEGNRRVGSISSHDISLPLGSLAEFITRADETVASLGPFRINCFGHVGDGNLHYNVFPPAGSPKHDHHNVRAEMKKAVHDLVHAFGGSVSAEHGIGRLKVDDLERYGDPAKLSAIRAIKAALDPKGIMNPGVILRAGGA